MLNRLNIVMIVYLLAFFFFQAQSYDYVSYKAEAGLTQLSCCKNSETSSHAKEHDKKSCCCDAAHGDTNDCSGSCEDYTCQSFPHIFYTTPSITKDVQDKFILRDRKYYSLYQQPSCSSGFSSIWQPPQIC